MVSQPSKRLTFETDQPPQEQEGGSSRPTFAPPPPPPPSSPLLPALQHAHRPPHLQPFLNSQQQQQQTPPRPILLSPTTPTAPPPAFHGSTPTRSRTRALPDEFLTSLSRPRQPSAGAEPEPNLNNDNNPSSPTPAPQFAEQLSTPSRRHAARPPDLLPPPALDQDGFYDASEGDLYRGPGPSDPRPTPNRRFRYDTSGRELDEDAITLRSVSSGRSSGSSSTDASVMSRSRRRVVGALEAVGRGLGVLGSDYSRSSSSSESDEEEAVAGAGDRMARKRSFSKKHVARRKRRGRAWSFGRSSTSGSSSSSESDDEPLGRRRAAGRREFVLLLPPPAQDPPLPTFLSPSSSATPIPSSSPPTPPPSRLIRTPYLPDVLKAIKELRNIPSSIPTRHKPHRLATSLLPPQPTSRPTTPVPLTPRQLLNASMLPTLPSQSHDPTQRRPPQLPLPFSAATNARFQIPRPSPNAPFPSSPQPSPPTSGTTTPTSYFPGGGGLPKVVVDGPTPAGTPTLGVEGESSPPKESTKAWWLDVHCPGWEDMRAIGELFALHPLTLEDILHQDPREKLETFERLGYYLISFRAIDESYFRYTDEPTATSSATSPSILSPDAPPADPTLGPTNPDLPGNPSKEPVLISSNVGGGPGGGMRGGGRKGRRRGKVEIQEDRPGKEGLEGVGVGAVNVYLVVFRDGIISFHFDDISKHTQGVRDRLLSLEEGRTLSSDWIAHGLMDSIVDSFFPLIDYIEFEADDIDSQIVSHDELVDDGAFSGDTSSTHSRHSLDLFSSDPKTQFSTHSSPKLERDSDSFDADKKQPPTAGSFEMSTFQGGGHSGASTPHPTLRQRARTNFHLPFPSLPPAFLVFFYTTLAHILLFLRLHPSQIHARAQRRRLKDPHTRFRTRHSFDRAKMLKRMTDTRRLITGLSRLLIPKSEVVGRLRKRAEEVSGRRSGWQHGGVGGEMVTYIGDIQDHILSMQSTLLHYEQILSQAQPAYVSQLRVSLAVTRGVTDKAILSLSVVSIGILPMQFISGMFSMNVNRPQNGDEDHRVGVPLNVFGIVVCAVALCAAGVIAVVRYWKKKAFSTRKGLEGRAMS
ncbi:hypothetical protein BDY24DRAFT_383090 [Mrakia frigida]|uniref:magnesium transporter CorA family protein n=1 Tax=Mrakia frigida TaxID=29902 RepID=UPI003FCBFC8D